MWPQNLLVTHKSFVSQVSPGTMFMLASQHIPPDAPFWHLYQPPLTSSDLMCVLHNQRGMSSPLLLRLGDIIFLLPGRVHSLLIALIQPKAALLLGSHLLAACEMTVGNRSGYTWEKFLYCITEVHQGDIQCTLIILIIFPKREENGSFPSNTLTPSLFLLKPSRQIMSQALMKITCEYC